MLNRSLAACAVIFSVFVLPGCGGGGDSGGNVASVDGQNITRADFDAKMEAGPQGKSTLTQLVQAILIENYAKANNIVVSDADVQKKEDAIKARFTDAQWQQTLAQQGFTEDDVHRILRDQAILQKAVDATIVVTPADIQDYLSKNHATLDTAEQVRARHILVPDLKTAELVEAKLKAGAKFEDLAKQYSTDPSSKDKGGDLGYFSRGQMVPTFQAAAFSQKIGVVGPPVKSPFGFHIIEVLDKKPPQVATLANSGDKIKTLLQQQQEQAQIPQFLANLRAKANIVIYDSRLKDALPTPPPAAPPPTGAPAPAST